MADLETLLADSRYFADQGSDPAAPSAGEPVIYTKSGALYLRNSSAIVGPMLDETGHDALDHTGLTGVGSGSSALVGASVYHSVAQAINHNTVTTLAFNTEEYDTDGFHDTVTNNSRLTVPSGADGYYAATAQIAWETDITGDIRSVRIMKNGTTNVAISSVQEIGAAAGTIQVMTMRPIPLVATDFLQVQVYQDVGEALDVQRAADYSPYFAMWRVGTA